MLLENIQNNIFEYLEDFEPEQIDKRKIKIVFCDKEMVIDVYDYYAIYALNLFFNFFNCIEDGDLINNFIKTVKEDIKQGHYILCLLYTSPSPRDGLLSRMPSSA
jgi:hypothetical protein